MAKNTNRRVIAVEHEAREGLKKGADTLANILKGTLGPSGRNVVIGVRGGQPVITNDGVSIAKEVFVEDEIEDLGVRIMRDVSMQTNAVAGDGSTGCVVTAQAILDEQFGKLKSNPVKVKRELDSALEKALVLLKAQVKTIKNKDDMRQVATVSSESSKLGTIIGNIFEKIGKNGTIIRVENTNPEVEYELPKGMYIQAGFYLHAEGIQNDMQVHLKQSYFIVSDIMWDVEHMPMIRKLVEKIADKDGNCLSVFGMTFTNEIMKEFNTILEKDKFRVMALSAPYMYQKGICRDIAAFLGGTFFDREQKPPEELGLTELGFCERVIAGKQQMILIKGAGTVEHRVEQLQNEIKKTRAESDKRHLEERISSMEGSIGMIKVGAKTKTEYQGLNDKIEDAVNATRWGMREGIVAGGGLALKKVSEKLPKGNILKTALLSTYNQIQENAGGQLDIGKNIFDPYYVIKVSLENAVSVAGTFITANAAINHKFEKSSAENIEDSLGGIEDEIAGMKQN